jgi:hypothetical protein
MAHHNIYLDIRRGLNMHHVLISVDVISLALIYYSFLYSVPSFETEVVYDLSSLRQSKNSQNPLKWQVQYERGSEKF